MPPRKTPKTTTAKPRVLPPLGRPPRPADNEVARRAYELFIARGGTHGGDVDDWLLAQRELAAES
jgi:hypothetical protein